jgi:hypothetical protein
LGTRQAVPLRGDLFAESFQLVFARCGRLLRFRSGDNGLPDVNHAALV